MKKAAVMIIIVAVVVAIGLGIAFSNNNQFLSKGNETAATIIPQKAPKNYQVNMTESVGVTSSP